MFASNQTNQQQSDAPRVVVGFDVGSPFARIAIYDPRLASASHDPEWFTPAQTRALMAWLEQWLAAHLCATPPAPQDRWVAQLVTQTGVSLPTLPLSRCQMQAWLAALEEAQRWQILYELVLALANPQNQQPPFRAMRYCLAAEMLNGWEDALEHCDLSTLGYRLLSLPGDELTAVTTEAGKEIPLSPAALQEQAGSTPVPTNTPFCDCGPLRAGCAMRELPPDKRSRRQGILSWIGGQLKKRLRQLGQIYQKISSRLSAASKRPQIGVRPPVQPTLQEQASRQTQPPLQASSNAPGDHPAAKPAWASWGSACQEVIRQVQAEDSLPSQERATPSPAPPDPLDLVVPLAVGTSTWQRTAIAQALQPLVQGQVDTTLDESCAALVYYVWQQIQHQLQTDPLGGWKGVLARCRRDEAGRAYQHVLIYHLGASSVEVTLARVTYNPLPPGSSDSQTRAVTLQTISTSTTLLSEELITLLAFRLIKLKLGDCFLTLLEKLLGDRHITVPEDGWRILSILPEVFRDDELLKYRSGSLLQCPLFDHFYETLNSNLLELMIPTRFALDPSRRDCFEFLWQMARQVIQELSTPRQTTSALVWKDLATQLKEQEWPQEVVLDHEAIFKLICRLHPWLATSSATARDFAGQITSCAFYDSLAPLVAASLDWTIAFAREQLAPSAAPIYLDAFFLSGRSVSLPLVQQTACRQCQQNQPWLSAQRLFYLAATAESAVALGACIMAQQMNAPSPLGPRPHLQLNLQSWPCLHRNSSELGYESSSGYITICTAGQNFPIRNLNGSWCMRTPLHQLYPFQESCHLYLRDYPAAPPLCIGILPTRSALQDYLEVTNFSFEKLAPRYLIGFEVTADYYVRAFIIPKQHQYHLHVLECQTHPKPPTWPELVQPPAHDQEPPRLRHTIALQTPWALRPIIAAGAPLVFSIILPDGQPCQAALSDPLPLWESYCVVVHTAPESHLNPTPLRFSLDRQQAEHAIIACDSQGNLLLLTETQPVQIIWCEMEILGHATLFYNEGLH